MNVCGVRDGPVLIFVGVESVQSSCKLQMVNPDFLFQKILLMTLILIK